MEHGIKFLGLIAFTWLFVEGSAPIEFLKKLAGIHNGSEISAKKLVKHVVRKLVNCALCSGFWIGLIYYQDILLACLTAIGSEIFKRLINLTFSKI